MIQSDSQILADAFRENVIDRARVVTWLNRQEFAGFTTGKEPWAVLGDALSDLPRHGLLAVEVREAIAPVLAGMLQDIARAVLPRDRTLLHALVSIVAVFRMPLELGAAMRLVFTQGWSGAEPQDSALRTVLFNAMIANQPCKSLAETWLALLQASDVREASPCPWVSQTREFRWDKAWDAIRLMPISAHPGQTIRPSLATIAKALPPLTARIEDDESAGTNEPVEELCRNGLNGAIDRLCRTWGPVLPRREVSFLWLSIEGLRPWADPIFVTEGNWGNLYTRDQFDADIVAFRHRIRLADLDDPRMRLTRNEAWLVPFQKPLREVVGIDSADPDEATKLAATYFHALRSGQFGAQDGGEGIILENFARQIFSPAYVD
ncbi:MAG: hypothetical protein NT133_03620 [Alphaproteobacteria bacterium]|nr:hypothetical protein [Alphaproteobacteria bacterium]